MLKKDIKMVMGLGLGCFLAASIVLRWLMPHIIDMEQYGAFPWAKPVGIVLLIVGIAEFIYERWHGFAFFSGKSQHGGSNANSFIVLAIAVAALNFSQTRFAAVLAVMSIVLLVLGFGLNTLREQKGIE